MVFTHELLLFFFVRRKNSFYHSTNFTTNVSTNVTNVGFPYTGPRRPKDPRRKGFASFARVYTSSSAPQCERIGPRRPDSYHQINKHSTHTLGSGPGTLLNQCRLHKTKKHTHTHSGSNQILSNLQDPVNKGFDYIFAHLWDPADWRSQTRRTGSDSVKGLLVGHRHVIGAVSVVRAG